LWSGEAPEGGVSAICYAPKGDGLCIVSRGELIALKVDNPHPEVGFSALFREVWYQGSGKPEHVWHSDGGSAHFEPKLGLVPLISGTLKGTLYSLFLAIPLGVLGALYTSQFLAAELQRYIKPAVEVMAALPTVILGFIAGLWLAPAMAEHFPGLLSMAVAFPCVLVLASRIWERVPKRLRNRLPEGSEVLFFTAVLGLTIWSCILASAPLEALVFAGDFRSWIQEVFGIDYDQRNAIVVGVAMGFAVIPIVFSISEEAFSSVPRSLVSGSLALGASRWQTTARIVVPTASPGVFAAVMVGFGRAVGETMIVLMATGNTPIIDWSPFNGFRTLSANIAVEIPEAPQGGTLYRTLFLSALILFAITFVVNTAAEVVRHRLRRRFGQL
jgi:phosphate transport system permease protein